MHFFPIHSLRNLPILLSALSLSLILGCAANHPSDYSQMSSLEFQKAASSPDRSDSTVKALYLSVKPEIESWLKQKRMYVTAANDRDTLKLYLYPSGYLYFDKNLSCRKLDEDKKFTSAHLPPHYSLNINTVLKLDFIKSDTGVTLDDSPKIYPEERGGRSKQSIQKVVMKNIPKLRRLYNSHLITRHNFKGQITVMFAIDEFGKVISCKAVSSSMKYKAFDQKIIALIKAWEFPVIHKEGDVTEVTYPFVFSP